MADAVQETVEMLREQGLNLAQVSRDTGLGYEWLKKMKYGEIDNPTYKRLDRLRTYLKARKYTTA